MNDKQADPSTPKPSEPTKADSPGDAPSAGPADTLPLTPVPKRADDSRLLSGKFGRYEILRQLGRGGMGEVYLALDEVLHRQVALKVPRTDEEIDSETVERFYREARTAAQLSHPNLCAVYDVGEIDGRLYLAMPYIAGESLAAVLNRQRLTPAQVVSLVGKLALAVEEAHRVGILHRDLKPGNVMLNERGEPVVMDFGLARLHQQHDMRLTRTGAMLGTPAYASPEQLQGDLEALTPASDVYSLGVMLFEMLTGRLPFEGSLASMLKQALVDPPPPPSSLAPDVDPRLEAICLRMLEKKPSDRFTSMAELAAALREVGDVVVANVVVESSPLNPPLAPLPRPPLSSRPPVTPPPAKPLLTQLPPAPSGKASNRSARVLMFGCAGILLSGLLACVAMCGALGYYGPEFIKRLQADLQFDPNWNDLAKFWQPPATMPPDFSLLALPNYEFKSEEEVETIPGFELNLPARHAVFHHADGDLDLYVAAASELEKEGIFRKVDLMIHQHDDNAPNSANLPDYPRYPDTRRSGGPDSNFLSYQHRRDYKLPGDAAVFWWDEGWLFIARSNTDADPRGFLRDLLAATNAKSK